jgi:trehalose/maltose hydrolase-like predicted phosphorylase
MRVALRVLAILQARDASFSASLLDRLDYHKDLAHVREVAELLYVPEPDPETLVIEQFDGYHKLEDVSLSELKSRIKMPTEYLGGGSGLATTTQVLKQADVVALLTLFKSDYPPDVKLANWLHYEQRTEQGSTLSASLYATLAAHVGLPLKAYSYFMTTATVDLAGSYKRYVGTLYIGGTHPGANGGAWMAVVHGFAGLHFDGTTIVIAPALPSNWTRVSFNFVVRRQAFHVVAARDEVRVTAAPENTTGCDFLIANTQVCCGPGESVAVAL